MNKNSKSKIYNQISRIEDRFLPKIAKTPEIVVNQKKKLKQGDF